MKVHYFNILLFPFSLNIMLLSSQVYNQRNHYITLHMPNTESIKRHRSLCECDLYMPNYDNDPQMKEVMDNFNKQTQQRFNEYDDRMNEKRQKRKEQRDKNIDEIIKKDRMDKSLAEKVEKCCLICGCGLGGVAASVGIFGTVAVKELTKAAITTATELAKEEAMVEGVAKGAAAGKEFVIAKLQEMGISTLRGNVFETLFTAQNYNNVKTIALAINTQYDASSCPIHGSGPSETFCALVNQKSVAALKVQRMTQGGAVSTYEVIETAVKPIVSEAETVAAAAAKKATEEAIKASTDAVESAYAACQTAIIASVVAILVIVLVMMIIYLILRYRRKKKMNKRAQYTKLLNQ
ncbi:hypothetical protein PFNF54_05936 [Plasmodium falciparum NF54]|uniref:Rifin n=1 Tax=Plasmodium falciparum (isolate NF54) TaxID=5843 RepID=W7JWU5_PLAFO|nr:hypothetical protein PFNF54_05936 [Plasmodium falciparum NF54]